MFQHVYVNDVNMWKLLSRIIQMEAHIHIANNNLHSRSRQNSIGDNVFYHFLLILLIKALVNMAGVHCACEVPFQLSRFMVSLLRTVLCSLGRLQYTFA